MDLHIAMKINNRRRILKLRAECESMLQREYVCSQYVEIKWQLDATEVFIADLIACSTCFGHHYVHHQELKSIIQWLLSVVFRAVVFKLLVWCGAEGYVSGLQDMFQAPLCPSSGAQEYYTVVAVCGTSCCGLQDAEASCKPDT